MGLAVSLGAAQGPNLGRPLSPEEIQKVDITVAPDGKGLPPGSGSVAAGAAVYATKCQACHGPDGAGKPMEQLTGGVGTLAHLVEGVREGHASAVLAASIFHYGEHSIGEAKRFMAASGLPVRLDQ